MTNAHKQNSRSVPSPAMRFILFHRNVRVGPIPLSGEGRTVYNFNRPFEELDRISFTLENARKDMDYELCVGDHPITRKPRHYQGALEWESAAHFTNCFGKIYLVLRARQRNAVAWRDIFTGHLFCYPSKLTYAQFQRMMADISDISKGLLFDVISKSQGIFAWSETSMVQEMSGLEEYVVLSQLVAKFETILDRINRLPDTGIEVHHIRQMCYGYERFSQRSVARMAAAGVNPRGSNVKRPFMCEIQRKVISYDTWENRQLACFCEFISSRLTSVINRARQQIAQIEEDREWRKIAPKGQVSLWDLEDRERIENLERSIQACRQLQEKLDSYPERFKFLSGLSPAELDLKPTPRFLRDLFYSHAYTLMTDFINVNGVLFDSSTVQQKLKDTSKLYEYWVYILLYSYLTQRLGLTVDLDRSVFANPRENIFVLNIHSGGYTSFLPPETRFPGTGLRVRLHYEPIFFPDADARQKEARFYRSGLVENRHPLQPDIFLEVITGPEEYPDLEYGLIIDCKYSRRILEHHWDDTGKYLFQLFESVNDRNVTNQLWLFYPGVDTTWKTNFGNIAPEHLIAEQGAVVGELAIAPIADASGQTRNLSRERLFDQLDKSVGGVLRFFLKDRSGNRDYGWGADEFGEDEVEEAAASDEERAEVV